MGNGIPEGYALNSAEDTIAQPLLTGDMVHHDPGGPHAAEDDLRAAG